MSCPSQDDLVGYALGALEPREERKVAKHSSRCERCTAELRRLAPAVGALTESVEQVEPPGSLRQSLMATVHSEAAEPSGVKPVAPRRERVRGFLWRPAAALGATALVMAGAAGYVLRDEEENVREISFNASTGDAGGTIEVEGDAATLHARGMKALAKGAVYQVWVDDGGTITPSATFVPHADGTATAAVPEVADGVDQVMVTKETMPGHISPTGPRVLAVRID